MKQSHPTFKVLASFVFIVVLTTVAQAQATRTWVAGNGNDANPCTNPAPCRTFAAALIQTAAGGEINAKNAGNFGVLNIDKSVTIDGGGTFSGIQNAGAVSGVRIDDFLSGTPNTAVVTLRNLSINGAGPVLAPNGVYFGHGKTLNIENCRIFNFYNTGITINFYLSGANVSIKNTSIFNTLFGVFAITAVTIDFATVSINGCDIEQNSSGVLVYEGVSASIRDSVIQFNSTGVSLDDGSTVNISGSQLNHNHTALQVDAGATATIGSSTFMDNLFSNFSNSGTIQTFGNNETADPIPGVVMNLGLR